MTTNNAKDSKEKRSNPMQNFIIVKAKKRSQEAEECPEKETLRKQAKVQVVNLCSPVGNRILIDTFPDLETKKLSLKRSVDEANQISRAIMGKDKKEAGIFALSRKVKSKNEEKSLNSLFPMDDEKIQLAAKVKICDVEFPLGYNVHVNSYQEPLKQGLETRRSCFNITRGITNTSNQTPRTYTSTLKDDFRSSEYSTLDIIISAKDAREYLSQWWVSTLVCFDDWFDRITSMKLDDSQIVWQKYQPKTIEEFLISDHDKPKISLLEQWLKQFRPSHLSNVAIKEESNLRQYESDTSSSSNLSDYSDFQEKRPKRKKILRKSLLADTKVPLFEIDGSFMSDESLLQYLPDLESAKAILIYSKSNSNTCLVSALAKDACYEVLEINSTSKRDGATILETCSESLQSHRVQNKLDFFEKKQKKKTDEKLTLLLIEEVDVLFSSDAGFWKSILTIISTSKRPIVLTCSDLSALPQIAIKSIASGDISFLYLGGPLREEILAYASIIAYNEGVLMSPDVVKDLMKDPLSDFRSVLNQVYLFSKHRAGDTVSYFAFVRKRLQEIDNEDVEIMDGQRMSLVTCLNAASVVSQDEFNSIDLEVLENRSDLALISDMLSLQTFLHSEPLEFEYEISSEIQSNIYILPNYKFKCLEFIGKCETFAEYVGCELKQYPEYPVLSLKRSILAETIHPSTLYCHQNSLTLEYRPFLTLILSGHYSSEISLEEKRVSSRRRLLKSTKSVNFISVPYFHQNKEKEIGIGLNYELKILEHLGKIKLSNL